MQNTVKTAINTPKLELGSETSEMKVKQKGKKVKQLSLLLLLSLTLFGKNLFYDTTTKLTIADNNSPKLSWYEAQEYCYTLKLGGIDEWRLPTISEMVSFEDRANTKTFLKKELHNTKRYDYWSATQDAMVKEYAWSQGLMYKAYNHTHNKRDKKYVRCVYSKEPSVQPFYVKYKDVVVEKRENLMFQDNQDAKSKTLNFKEAKKYCHNLTLQGYDDWLLPDVKTLRSLVDYERFSPSIDNAFKYTSVQSYYSSTLYGKDSAENIGFNNGIDGHINKTQAQHVRCYHKITPTNQKVKVSLFFNYDNATLFIDGKKWGKLHTLLDDYQTTGDINISLGIHHFEIQRKSDTEEVSGSITLKFTKADEGKIVNVLASESVN